MNDLLDTEDRPAGGHRGRGRRLLDEILGSLRRPRAREEAFWVFGPKAVIFVLQFVGLKLYTNLLGRDGFGEFSLAVAGMALANVLLVSPMEHSYLRQYHTAEEKGTSRHTGLVALKWYTAATLIVLLLAALLTAPAAGWFGLGTYTVAAAGLVFVTDRWRMFGAQVLNVRRERKKAAGVNLAFLAAKVLFIAGALYFIRRTPSVALAAFAVAAAVAALPAVVPIVRRILSAPSGGRGDILHVALTFGLPMAALLLCQWIQNFADRYIVAGVGTIADAGQYTAAYQLCGAPYMFMTQTFAALLMPIAYQRARSITDAAQLKAGDRVVFAGLAAYMAVGSVLAVALALAGNSLLVVLTSAEFGVPVAVIVFLAASRFFQGAGVLLQMVFQVHRQALRSLGFRIVGALIMIPACYYGARAYGMIGAAAGSMAASTAYLLLLFAGPGGAVWMVRGRPAGAPPADPDAEAEEKSAGRDEAD